MNVFSPKIHSALFVALAWLAIARNVTAQSIIPAPDGTGTIVNIEGNEFVIEGGTLSGDGANLFHSLLEFGLDANQIATFLTDPQIQNILGRVTGGNPSVIDGLVQVLGGNANLYLMNPSGFVFGANASLNVPGDFFATTADRMGFGNGLWFDVWGDNNYENLTGTPIEFGFGENAGEIVNGGDLAVGEGQTLALLGAQVINTGNLSAPSGNIAISAVGETGRLRMVRQGNVLGFEFVPPTDAKGNALPIAATDIPALITGSGVETHVTVAGDRLLHNGVELPNSVGSVALSGELETAGQTGGNVDVVGDIVALLGVAIDASGTEGGGNVRIGGNAKETGKKFNARRTLVDRDTVLNADALVNGDGGRIVVSADENLGFFGDASARGGSESGDGGLIAIASNNNLVFEGNLDVGAAVEENKNGDRTLLGDNGTIRFKSKNIRIQPSATIQETIANSESAILLSEVPENGDLIIGDTTISELTGNLILQADRDIFVEADSSDLADSVMWFFQNDDSSIQDEHQDTQVLSDLFADLFPDPSKLSEISEDSKIEFSTITSQDSSTIMEQAQIDVSETLFLDQKLGETITFQALGNINLNANLETAGGDLYIQAGQNVQAQHFGNHLAWQDLRTNGDISIIADGNITADNFRQFGDFGYGDPGGNISLISREGNIAIGDIQNFSEYSDGGNVNIVSLEGSISANSIVSSGSTSDLTGAGYGGNITLRAKQDITINQGVISSSGRSSAAQTYVLNRTTIGYSGSGAGTSQGGQINITSQTGNIIVGETGVHSYSSPRNNRSFFLEEESNPLNSRGGNIRIEAAGNIELGAIASFSGTGTNTAVNFGIVPQLNSINTDLNISSPKTSYEIGISQAGHINVISHNGSITVDSGIDSSSSWGFGGNVRLQTPGNITTRDIRTNAKQDGGSISAISESAIDTSSGLVNSMGGKNGGNITLDAVDDINTSGIGSTMLLTSFDANSGNLHIESEGRVNTNEAPLVTASGTGRGGNIYIYGREDVTTGNINARSFARRGGEIYIDSSNSIRANDKIETNRNDITFNSSVELNDNVEISIRDSGNIRFNETVDGQHDLNLNTGTGTVYFNDEVGISAPLNNLNIRGEVSSSDTPIEIATVNNMTTGNITSSNGIALTSQDGRITSENLDTSAVDDAGNITLQGNNISVATINAQSENGTGGNVTAIAPQFFQATDTFSDRNGQNASISVAGAVEGGEVKIYHGGNGQTPFIVGDASINGTTGEITRGNDAPEQSIETYQEYPYTHKQDSDRLQIVSVPQPQIPIQPEPTPAPHPVTPPPEIPEPLEELDRGKNPIEDLAFLIGDILNAQTTISTDETGDYAFEWQTTNPNTGEQVLLSLNADNPYPEETANSPEIAPISAPILPSLNTLTALNFNANPEQLIADIDQLLEDEYETYFGEDLADKEVTAQSIRETLKTIELETGTRAVVIYALPLPDALQLVLVRPDAPPLVHRVPEADPRTLKQTVALFRHRIADKNHHHYLNSAQKLHAWLVAPLADELDRLEIDTLVFSLGGTLRSLPLAALHDGQQFLIERYSLGTIPSMSLTDTRYASIKNAKVLGMGASEFPNTPYEPLPAVPTELATVTTSLASGESFLNEEFTLDNLKTQRDRGNFQIVHLATHASFQPQYPQNAHIQFWDEKIGLDGLRKARWYDNAAVELLVLSACETAVGDRRVELGFGGLAVQAGVKSTVASLWKVSDMGTSVLMEELYRALANPDIPIKAEALRQAQLRMLYGEAEPPSEFGELSVDFSHPYYWTGFSLIGSPW